MKIAGFDKAIVYQMGGMFDAVNEEKGTMTPLHQLLMSLPQMSEEAVHSLATGQLSDALAEHAIEDPAESSYRSFGFAPYGEEVNGVFALAIPGTKAIVLRVEKRERVLPGVSVRNEVGKRMAELQKKEIDGWKPTRKDWAEMREEVEARMLKNAPIRPTIVNIVIDTPYIYTFSSSAKVVEDCSALLRKAMGSWPVGHALVDEFNLRRFMGDIILGEVPDTEVCNYVHLKHDDGDDLKLKDTEIEGDDFVLDRITSHYTVRALDISVDTGYQGIGSVNLRLADKAILSGIHIGEADYDAQHEATLERYGTDGTAFLTMMANLFQLVISLRELMVFFEKNGQVVEFERHAHRAFLASALFDFRESLAAKGISVEVVENEDDEDDDEDDDEV